MVQYRPPLPSLWRQIWGLVALLAAILISFKAYEFYQPSILGQLGFAGILSSLDIFQGLLGMIVEPLLGNFSDRILQRFGSRLPQITLGITLAGLIFILVAWLLRTNSPLGLRWFVPLLMLVWFVAMIAVRGPVVAMLRQLAPIAALPQANALIILVLGLIAAANPLIERLLKTLGASPTFIIGAIALLIGVGLLSTTQPPNLTPFPKPDRPASPLLLALIFGAGVRTSLEMGLVLSALPAQLHPALAPFPLEWVGSILLLISALFANPLGTIVTRLGAVNAMQIGLGTLVLSLGVTGIFTHRWAAIALLLIVGGSIGLLSIGIVPFALSQVSLSQAGLSTGLYFGGSGLAGAIAAVLRQTGALSGWMTIVPAIAAFLLAVVCLRGTRFYASPRSPANNLL